MRDAKRGLVQFIHCDIWGSNSFSSIGLSISFLKNIFLWATIYIVELYRSHLGAPLISVGCFTPLSPYDLVPCPVSLSLNLYTLLGWCQRNLWLKAHNILCLLNQGLGWSNGAESFFSDPHDLISSPQVQGHQFCSFTWWVLIVSKGSCLLVPILMKTRTSLIYINHHTFQSLKINYIPLQLW